MGLEDLIFGFGKVTLCNVVSAGASFCTQAALNYASVNFLNRTDLSYYTTLIGKGVGLASFAAAYYVLNWNRFRQEGGFVREVAPYLFGILAIEVLAYYHTAKYIDKLMNSDYTPLMATLKGEGTIFGIKTALLYVASKVFHFDKMALGRGIYRKITHKS